MGSAEPTDDELGRFAQSALGSLEWARDEPDARAAAIEAHRDLWVMLYRVEHRFGNPP